MALLVGRLGTGGGNFLTSAVPRLLAVHATLKPHRALTVAPRLMTSMGRRAEAAGETGVGVGGRAVLSRQVQVVGDIGGSRTVNRQWAPLAVVGVIGESARGRIEGSVRRAGTGFRLLGSVPFAAQDRELVAGRLALARGLAFEGQFSRTRPSDSTSGVATVARAVTVRIDRFRHSALSLGHEQVVDRTRVSDTLTVEWRPTAQSGPVVRLEQRSGRENAGHVSHPARQLDVRGSAAPNGRVSVDYRVWLQLASLTAGAPRVRSELKGRIVVTSRIVLSGETDLRAWTRAALDGPQTLRRFEATRMGCEINLSRISTLHLVYHHAPHSSKPLAQRFEGRLTRVIRF